MSRTLHWNDEYCPNGHKWVFVPASTLYPDYYYCSEEDEFWEPTVRKLKVIDIAKQYNGDRPNAMIVHALAEEAMRDMRYKKSATEIIAFLAPPVKEHKTHG